MRTLGVTIGSLMLAVTLSGCAHSEKSNSVGPGSTGSIDIGHSRQQLDDLAKSITADMAYWVSRGIQINMVGPALDGKSVEVGVADPEAAQDVLYAKYGRNNITVVAQGSLSMEPYNGPLPTPTR